MHDLLPAPTTAPPPAPAARAPWWRRVPLPCALVLTVTGGTIAASALLGVLAAAVGGPLSALGAGPGGLWGVPQLVLLGVAGLVGAPFGLAAVLRGVRRRVPADVTYGGAMIVGPLLVAFGSFFVPHALEPCAAGTFDLTTRVASAPVCSRYEHTAGGITIDDRFHLLLHGGVTAPLAVPVLLFVGHAASRRAKAVAPMPAATTV